MKLLRYITGITMLIAWCAFVNGCSPQRKMQRLVKKHPELMRVDTVRILDTVRIPSVRVDTMWSVREFHELLHDTIVLTNERLRVEIWRHDSIIKMSGECADTIIIRELQIPVDRVIIEKRQGAPTWLLWLVIGVAAALLLVFLMKK
jgi:hypothetical protein